jgi:microsomal dipeptidase-like Zn-dependent dipeptidase
VTRWLPLFLPLLLLGGAPVPAHAKIPVIDLRVGLSLIVSRDGSLAEGQGQAGYLELARGNVIGVVLPIPGHSEGRLPGQDATTAFFALRTALSLSQKFELRGCARPSSRIATWISLEAPDELARDPSQVRLWVTRGVRVFAIASGRDNEVATSASRIAPGPVTGLTHAGREVVRQVLANGALIDVSDASDLSIDDVVEMARPSHAPVVATHSNASALADNPLNLGDAQIREIAATNGVIGVTAVHGTLAPGRAATMKHLVRQILYLVRVAGPEHVALGIGFEAGVSPLIDLKSAADSARLAADLHDAGMSDENIAGVFYENALRVLCTGGSAARGDAH